MSNTSLQNRSIPSILTSSKQLRNAPREQPSSFSSRYPQLFYLRGWSYRSYEAPLSESTSTIEFERFDPRKPPDCFSSFTQWQTNPMLHHHQNSQYISRSPQQASHSLHSTWATTANNPWRDTQTHQSCQKKKWQNHTTNWRLLLFPLSLSTIFFPVSLMTHSFWTHSPWILIVMTRYFLEWMMMMSYGREWKIVMSCWSYKCWCWRVLHDVQEYCATFSFPCVS